MSKDNYKYNEELARALFDQGAHIDAMSNALEQKLSDLIGTVITVSNRNNVSDKEVKAAINALIKGLRTEGAKPSSQYQESLKQLADYIKSIRKDQDKLDFDKFIKALSNHVASAIIQSEKAKARGSKDAYFKGDVAESNLLKVALPSLAKILHVEADNLLLKFIGWATSENKRNNQQHKGMLEDLLEGLNKSKWVGGALRDTFRLVGLLGAQWLSQFGQLGKILGGAFYVSMELLGPHFVSWIIKGMGKALLGLTRLVGIIASKVGWGLINKLPMNGPLGNAIHTFYGGGTAAQKVAAVRALAAPTAVVAAGTIGAVAAGKGAIDSWKEGRKGNAAAFGAGALAFGGAAIGGLIALITGAMSPIVVPLLAIGATLTGLAAAWKAWGPGIQDTMKKWLDEKAQDSLFWNWIKEHWPFKGKDKSGGSGGSAGAGASGVANYENSLGKGIDTKKEDKKGNYKSYGKMKVSTKDGSILNLNELSQDEASAALQAYEKDDPTGFGRLYEWVDSKHANLNSYQTDAVKKDEKGNKVAALGYKGATHDLDMLRKNLIEEKGMSPELANDLVYTSGKLTGSNELHGVGGWKSHNNPYALAFDLGSQTGKWRHGDYLDAKDSLQTFYNEKAKKGGPGFEVVYENDPSKGIYSHYDVKLTKNVAPQGAADNEEANKQKASSGGNSIAPKVSDKKKEEKVPEDTSKSSSSWRDPNALSPVDVVKGAFGNKEAQQKMANYKEQSAADVSGNRSFKDILTTMGNMGRGSTNNNK